MILETLSYFVIPYVKLGRSYLQQYVVGTFRIYRRFISSVSGPHFSLLL